MRRLIKALLIVPLAFIVVLFAIANRQNVRVSLDPFSSDAALYAVEAPLFAVVLAAIAIGILVGGFSAWLAQGKHRKAKRLMGKEAEKLRSEADSLRAVASNAALSTLPSR